MSEEARAEAERRYGRYRNSPRLAMSVGFVAGADWQASRPFTEEDVEAAAKAVASRYGHEVDAGYRKDARAALAAVTARHTKGDGA